MAHQLTTCTFCGVGCGLYLETSGGRIAGVYPSMSHPTNQGKICVRGWNVHEVASSPDRLKLPQLRRNGGFEEISWDEAYAFVGAKLAEIRDRHGPEAVAFLNSPRCSNEETYLLQKLARAVVGTNNVDHGTGVYCNNSIHVLQTMLGIPATTNAIGELGRSGAIVVDGVDLARQLPTIGGWVLRAKLAGAKLIVVDTRRHRLAESADCFLQLKPGTEVFLYGAIAKLIVDWGLTNWPFLRARCRDANAFLASVADYDLLRVAEVCGVPAEAIEQAALAYARAGAAAILYSTGTEARDVESIQAMVNLTLLTGNLGKEGAGLYALTEQNNLQGVCDMGMLPDRLPGYAPVADARARARLEAAWGCRLPAQPGCSARSVLDDRHGGRIRALWLCRYDPINTAVFGDAARRFEELDLVVVQHLFQTDTARHAHLILPTTAFGEETVSFTSTDRRIQLATQAIDPPPGPRPAWRQLAQLGRAMGAPWRYETAADVMDEIGTVVPFYSGANYENLSREYGRQWPCTKDQPLGTRFLFAAPDHNRPFLFAPVRRPPDPPRPPADYPLVLVFGHSLYYWHQNVLIQHSETLKREYRMLLLDYPQGFVEINTDDAQRFKIRDGERIRLRAATGSAVAAARVTPEVKPGTIFVPYFVREVEKQVRGQAGNGSRFVNVCLEKVVT
ncbi:MAG: molybdopterin-dependent oxidoreductase [Verrucomicrobia bacterium]|nr:molybdopterin-dependent oxidoreductase [Verrucomicrobiota bacterium]